MRWLEPFRTPIDALTRSQRLALGGVALVAAVSRLLAVARSPWDWDEMLFMLGTRHYDVTQHHPHPPGFPLFIAAAKALVALGVGEFRALQFLNVVAAMLLLPLAVSLARELRLRFETALLCGVILVALPNVWFYGGTAFSDIPSLALLLAAVTLLLRSVSIAGAFVPGCIVLGAAAAVRPQNLLCGAAAGLLAAFALILDRRYRRLAAGLLAGAVVLVLAYGVAAASSGGWSAWAEAVHQHQQYIARTDSFRNPYRPPVLKVANRFFFEPYEVLPFNVVLAVGMGAGAIAGLRRSWPALFVAAGTFGPMCGLALLTLDHFSASRFSLAWAPLVAVLVAMACAALGRIGTIGGALLALALAAWTLPALTAVRTTDSPPVIAFEAVKGGKETLLIDEGLSAFAGWYLPAQRIESVEGMPRASFPPRAGLVDGAAPGRVFRRPHGRLWDIARRRYFDVTLARLTAVQFAGCYDEESETEPFRWMGKAATITLPRVTEGAVAMTLEPASRGGESATVTVSANGRTVARVTGGTAHRIEFDVAGPGPITIALAADRTFSPGGGDPRLLGARIDSVVLFERH